MQTIIKRRELLWRLAHIKGANKDNKIYVWESTPMHYLLFWTHSLYMNNVTKSLILVSSSVRSKQQQLLYFLHGQGQKSEQKTQQWTLLNFITVPFYQLFVQSKLCTLDNTFVHNSLGFYFPIKTTITTTANYPSLGLVNNFYLQLVY